jgi:hypothetical protein
MTETIFTSLIHVVRHPDRYRSKGVAFIGFCRVEPDGQALFVSELDEQANVAKNAVWVRASNPQEIRQLHQKYVLVEGTFNAEDHGARGVYAGSLDHVSRFVKWSDPQNPVN